MSAQGIPARRWVRIIPAAFLMYTIAFMDRNNIAFGFFGIQQDLGVGATAAGFAGGIFFIGYLILQVPGALWAQRWSARKFIAAALLLWGIAAVATGFVQTYTQLLVARFLLGVLEGGVSPATMILLTKWFPLNERARANGYWYLCIPVASIVTAPISGLILTHLDWRWLFILEGLPPIIWAVVWWFMIDDEPSKAKWISTEEREYLETTIAAEKQEIKKRVPSLRDALHNRNVILLLVLFCFLQVGFYGYGLWLPTLMKSISGGNMMTVGWLSALPWVAAMFGSIINSTHSDKTGDYKWHIAIPILAAALFLTLSIICGAENPIPAIIALTICLGFLYCYAVYWAALSAFIAEDVLAIAMGTINAIGNLGGFFGPLMVGYIIETTHNFLIGEGVLVAFLFISGLFALGLKPNDKIIPANDQLSVKPYR